MNGEDVSDENVGVKTCGIKRKREDDEGVNLEELNFCKIIREESIIFDVSICGVKRKFDDFDFVKELSVFYDV